jgi:bacterioferritin
MINYLNDMLTTEILCVLCYKQQYMTSGRISSTCQRRAAARATGSPSHRAQLDGEPDFNRYGLSFRSHTEYAEGKDVTSMLFSPNG